MMRRACITRDVIDAAEVLAGVGGAGDGAVLLFLGTVRDHNEGRAVRGMRYDAYETMAERVLGEIVDEVAEATGASRIAAVHRVGELEVGEVSVAIAVSSPHRAEAYAASRRIMEEIKARLPVWKQEHYVEGVARWLGGETPPGTGWSAEEGRPSREDRRPSQAEERAEPGERAGAGLTRGTGGET